jgi:hypothetical protein
MGDRMSSQARCSIIKTSGAVLSLVLVLPGVARAEILINPQGWVFPNIVTSAKEMIRVSDRTPLIAGKETLLKGYRKMDGTHFMTFEIEGRVFGVLVDTDGKPPFEFSIMDTDGDGKFETKFNSRPESKDQGYVPQWIVDYYYTKHPDQKNPSGGTSKAAPPKLASVPLAGATPTPTPQPAKPSKEVLSQPNP